MANNTDTERDECPNQNQVPPKEIKEEKLSHAYLLAAFTMLIWGTSFSTSKFVVPQALNPISFTAIRTLFGFLILLLFLLMRGKVKEWWKVFKKEFKYFFLIGVFLYSFAYIVQFWGLSHTLGVHQSIIANTQAFWVAFFNYVFLKQKPSKKYGIGAIVAFLGVILVLSSGNDIFSLFNLLNLKSEYIMGDIISLFAFVLWGAYTFIMKPVTLKIKPLYATISVIFCGLFLLIPLSIINGVFNELPLLNNFQWGIMAYLGIFAIGFTFIAWNTALSYKKAKSENVALFVMLNPIIGVSTSAIFLGEPLTITSIMGMLLVIFSIFITNYNFNKMKKNN
ncbi:MAG: DMT family transporter [Promethearchaeota archaeon]